MANSRDVESDELFCDVRSSSDSISFDARPINVGSELVLSDPTPEIDIDHVSEEGR